MFIRNIASLALAAFALAGCGRDDVKVYHVDYSGKAAPTDYPVNERFDAKWNEHLESDNNLFWQACEDAGGQYLNAEWTNYPGIEQGEWKFTLNGRSNGHLILTDAPSWCPSPGAWRMFPMIWESIGAYENWLVNLATPTLRQFYRAIRVLDHDLRREAVEAEVSY